jgi:glutamyl-tRNA synthetase
MLSVSGFDEKKVRYVAKGYALLNAVEHGGKAALGPVMGKIIAEMPELKPYARQVARLVREIVEDVNRLSLEEQKRLLEEEYSWLIEKREAKRREAAEAARALPPLPNAEEGRVVTRFAPNPDFIIHLGNARAAILSYEYAVMYKGKMILRFEDTDPRTKTPLPEAYKLIKNDLKWLGIRWDEEYIQSLRMHIYYDIARKLIEAGGAYVDDRPAEEFRRYRNNLEKYPPRSRSVEENLELWDRMLEGYYSEGEAVLRVKTDPNHPDPSVRDWVAFRIIDTDKYPHPIVGSRYIVWPTYNFAAAVDDKLMGVTHILRAKEHMQNTIKQEFLYNHLGWSYPHVIHFGRLQLEGFIMSKSALKSLIEAGVGSGIDDPRFATIAGLRRRGITAEAIRQIMLEVGVKYTDASISFDNLAAINRSVIDPKSKRLMAVIDPVELRVSNLPWSKSRQFRIPYHPNGKLGERLVEVEGPEARIYISRQDAETLKPGGIVRLMEAFNITVEKVSRNLIEAKFHSLSVEEARRHHAPIIQWVSSKHSLPVEILRPEGLDLLHLRGLIEEAASALRPGEIIQLVRIGFSRVDSLEYGEDGTVRKIVLIYAHD